MAQIELAIIDGRFYFDNRAPNQSRDIIVAVVTTSAEARALGLMIKKALETAGSVVHGIEDDLPGLEPKERHGIWVFSHKQLASILRQAGVRVNESQQHWGRPAIVIGA